MEEFGKPLFPSSVVPDRTSNDIINEINALIQQSKDELELFTQRAKAIEEEIAAKKVELEALNESLRLLWTSNHVNRLG
jgi:hypothetical protein